jgi:hypothetical protein
VKIKAKSKYYKNYNILRIAKKKTYKLYTTVIIEDLIYLTLALITAINKLILNIINRPRRQGVNILRKGMLKYIEKQDPS